MNRDRWIEVYRADPLTPESLHCLHVSANDELGGDMLSHLSFSCISNQGERNRCMISNKNTDGRVLNCQPVSPIKSMQTSTPPHRRAMPQSLDNGAALSQGALSRQFVLSPSKGHSLVPFPESPELFRDKPNSFLSAALNSIWQPVVHVAVLSSGPSMTFTLGSTRRCFDRATPNDKVTSHMRRRPLLLRYSC